MAKSSKKRSPKGDGITIVAAVVGASVLAIGIAYYAAGKSAAALPGGV